MDLLSLVIPILFIGFAGIAIGSLVNYRRLRTGIGPNPTATALQVVSIVIVLVAASATIVTFLVDAGLWQVMLVGMAIGAAGAFVMDMAVHAVRARTQ
jgi:hypothetical protein